MIVYQTTVYCFFTSSIQNNSQVFVRIIMFLRNVCLVRVTRTHGLLKRVIRVYTQRLSKEVFEKHRIYNKLWAV